MKQFDLKCHSSGHTEVMLLEVSSHSQLSVKCCLKLKCATDLLCLHEDLNLAMDRISGVLVHV